MNNKVCLITGGASGLGLEISKILAKNNCNLIICYNTSSNKAKVLKEELENRYNINVLTIKCDISNEEEINNMVKVINDNFDHIDYLVNNAAICIDSLYDDNLFLRALESNGVDNWEWYGEAIHMYNEWREEDGD